MRVRTLFTFAAGAALGAGSLYLLDPDHGERRRRAAARGAARQARQGALRAATDVRRTAQEAATAAVGGYRQAREHQSGV